MSPPSLTDITSARLTHPDTLPTVCDHVASGGTILTLCDLWQIRYAALNRWLYDGGERETAYAAALAARGEWETERLLHELRRIGLVDLRKAFNEDGTLKPINKIPDDVAASLAGVEVFHEYQGQGENREQIGVTKKVKFTDKLRALELLGKKLRLFIDRTEHSGSVGLESLVAGAQTSAPPAA